ncbi:MAG: hypothetical protein D6738_05860 [Acidobacteria bacterium]|nr:MAG: hypothetical protein D6738_05860 [Acidobacteriota bacterium]
MPAPLSIAQIAPPDPLPLPAPGWLLWSLLMLTFFLHMLAMNWVLGGSIIGAVTRVSRRTSPEADVLVGLLTRSMPSAVAATITLGVAPLLFVQVLYGRLLFTSSILMGWFWLSVIPLLIIAYYAVYALSFRGDRLGGLEAPLSWLAALCFMAIGFLYSNNMTLMLRPDSFVSRYLADGRGFHLNLDDPTLVPRYLHMLLGALATSGMAIALIGALRRSLDARAARYLMRCGSLWFVIPTAINVLFGLWWLIALPRETMLRFMGGSAVASGALAIGLLAALSALLMMAMALGREDPRGLIRGGAWSLGLTLVAMVLMRDQVRQGALEAAGFEPSPWVEPQWGPIVLFVVLLVAALAAVAWMVRAIARPASTS